MFPQVSVQKANANLGHTGRLFLVFRSQFLRLASKFGGKTHLIRSISIPGVSGLSSNERLGSDEAIGKHHRSVYRGFWSDRS